MLFRSPEGQQDARIEGIVSGLEAKLKANPADVDRWIMLMRSRMTLGETSKAAQALKGGIAANPGAAGRLKAQAQLLGVPGAYRFWSHKATKPQRKPDPVRAEPVEAPFFSRRPKKSGPLRLPCRRSGQASTGSGRTERDNLCGFVALCEPFTPPSPARDASIARSEEHTSELQSLMRHSYAVFCLK